MSRARRAAARGLPVRDDFGGNPVKRGRHRAGLSRTRGVRECFRAHGAASFQEDPIGLELAGLFKFDVEQMMR